MMTTDKPKLMFHSNAPHTGTGYGSQCALFTPHLNKTYDCGISGFYGSEGNILRYKGMPVYPGIGQTHGNEVILDHCQVHFGGPRDGLVLTLLDVWVLDPAVWRKLNVASWVPVDHEPCPPPVGDFFRQSTAVPVAMSKFGQEQLAEFDALYVPHACDCQVYRPYPQAEARGVTGMPEDDFIVGMVAANKGNPSRKCFFEAFQAFKVLLDRHPECKLYLHTEVTGRFDGVNIPDMLVACGVPLDAVLFADQYRAVHFPFSLETMARVYSSLDVLLMPSAGEGFGIPALEAQACGVPVIGSDFSAQPEVIGSGWLVSGRKVYTPLKACQFLPDVEDIVEALESSYRQRGLAQIAEKARAHAETYHVDRVVEEFMLPALAEVESRFEERAPRELVAA